MIKSLSIILPLYNEEKRLRKSLKKIANFLKTKKIQYIEIIFVDDGSIDNSSQIILQFIKNFNKKKFIKLQLVKYRKNQGKGAALKKGVARATGDWILTSDIDFSVSLFELLNWQREKYINKNEKVYFGSRAHKNSNVRSKLYRKIIGNFLRILISSFLQIKIKDTQCGFKLYKKQIAKKIFFEMSSQRFEHDIEIILLLKKRKINIIELPVKWEHIADSKVNIFVDPLKVLISIFLLKFKYLR